jgi:hypothetical protein
VSYNFGFETFIESRVNEIVASGQCVKNLGVICVAVCEQQISDIQYLIFMRKSYQNFIMQIYFFDKRKKINELHMILFKFYHLFTGLSNRCLC